MNILPILLLAGAALVAPSLHAHEGMAGMHAASGAGQAGSAAAAGRSVTIGMHDSMRFSPPRISVREGETLRLDVVNEGRILHELVLGTAEEIGQLRAALRHDPQMAHAAPFMVHVAPGQRGEMVWQFTRAGVFEMACLLPGHYEAGMRGSVSVEAGGL